jgi:hypothetical protein
MVVLRPSRFNFTRLGMDSPHSICTGNVQRAFKYRTCVRDTYEIHFKKRRLRTFIKRAYPSSPTLSIILAAVLFALEFSASATKTITTSYT